MFCETIKFLVNKYFLTKVIEKEDIYLSVNKNIELKKKGKRDLDWKLLMETKSYFPKFGYFSAIQAFIFSLLPVAR